MTEIHEFPEITTLLTSCAPPSCAAAELRRRRAARVRGRAAPGYGPSDGPERRTRAPGRAAGPAPSYAAAADRGAAVLLDELLRRAAGRARVPRLARRPPRRHGPRATGGGAER